MATLVSSSNILNDKLTILTPISHFVSGHYCFSLTPVFVAYKTRIYYKDHDASNSFKITSIQEWSGEESLRSEDLKNPVPMAVIQHTVTNKCFTDDECEKAARSIRKYLIQIGQTDIGYNFLIGGNGKVYEGAGWNKVGAHTLGYNKESVGIGFIGTFQSKAPTPAALQAAQDLLNYGLDNKKLSQEYKLVGARQLRLTKSPGDALQDIIEDWPHWTSVWQKL